MTCRSGFKSSVGQAARPPSSGPPTHSLTPSLGTSTLPPERRHSQTVWRQLVPRLPFRRLDHRKGHAAWRIGLDELAQFRLKRERLRTATGRHASENLFLFHRVIERAGTSN